MRADFGRFWKQVQARYWVMTSRGMLDRLRLRPACDGRPRRMALVVDGRPFELTLRFEPELIQIAARTARTA